MQKRVILWILGAFYTTPTFGIEAIARLISIHLHIQKLNGEFQLRTHSLLSNHIIKLLLEIRLSIKANTHCLSLEGLIHKQCLKIKGSMVDIDNRFNKIIPSFSPFDHKFLLGNRLIDIFPNRFSFHSLDRKSKNNVKSHLHSLESVSLQSLSDSYTTIVVLDASIKNSVTTSIAHVHTYNSPVIKMIHHAVNITSTEVEIFTLQYGINQATQQFNINHIILITDSIHAAKRIFDSLPHPYQASSATISCELRKFFKHSNNNSIKLWDCPSCCNWGLHTAINKEMKQFNFTPIFPCKLSWNFSKKKTTS